MCFSKRMDARVKPGHDGVWLPDGQISKNLSSPALKNILLHSEAKSPAYQRHPVPHRGALAIVINVGRGERWTRMRS
jgi:hypothetical protein